jgi:hypothetical protein
MRNLLTIIFITVCASLWGKDTKYEVSAISEGMLKDATSVVRLDEQTFVISGPGKAIYSQIYAVTIMDESSYKRAIFMEPYDKFRKVKSIKASIYDKFGNEVKKIKYEDITDMSMIQSLSSFDDSRVKFFDPEYKFFPFTIEYSYEVQFTGLLSYPSWSPYKSYDESVEKSSMTVTAAKSFEFKYHLKNGAPEPVITDDASGKVYKWELTGLPAMKYQYFSHYDDEDPAVYLAPKEFEIGGERGFCNSWSEFASWISKLNANGNNLSEQAKKEINALIASVDDPMKKVEILYDYMQSKTRYVSIQLGIGGWKPFDANTVERLGYGDCKALTNYMKSILEVAGIKSNYVLVSAGKHEPNIITSFPSNQFNHAFLMVPMATDTIWLECTDQQVPFNYNGTFTDDRDVLVIEDGGGSIVRTPSYDEYSSFTNSVVNVTLDQEGNALVNATTAYAGAKYMDVFDFLSKDKKSAENALIKRIDITDFTITGFSYSDQKTEIVEDLNLLVAAYAKKSRNNLIMPLNLMNKVSSIPKKDDARKIDVFIRRTSSERDRIFYSVPAHFHAGTNPEPVHIESRFGRYDIKVEVKDDGIEYLREFVLYKGSYPPADYNALIDFLSEVAKADRMKIMLVSGT